MLLLPVILCVLSINNCHLVLLINKTRRKGVNNIQKVIIKCQMLLLKLLLLPIKRKSCFFNRGSINIINESLETLKLGSIQH